MHKHDSLQQVLESAHKTPVHLATVAGELNVKPYNTAIMKLITKNPTNKPKNTFHNKCALSVVLFLSSSDSIFFLGWYKFQQEPTRDVVRTRSVSIVDNLDKWFHGRDQKHDARTLPNVVGAYSRCEIDANK
jgi:hypothetical protein